MEQVSINKDMRLSEHFTLGEMTKTTYHPKDGNIPSHVAIENLRNLCENWLEELRYSYNTLYCLEPSDDYETSPKVEGIVINSAYRSEEVNHMCWGSPTSNHLTGCAADIRCLGPEQMIRYGAILLDMADGKRQDFDKLLLERRGTTYWIHLAVRPKDNRRKVAFDIR